MNNACMATLKVEINSKSIHNKPVEKSDNKQSIDNSSTINIISEKDSKFSTVLDKFSRVEKEETSKCEEKKEGEERKKDNEGDVLVDNIIVTNEVLLKEQPISISDFLIKNNNTEIEKVTLSNNSYQDVEVETKIFEILNTEPVKNSNTLNNSKLSNISKKLDNTSDEILTSINKELDDFSGETIKYTLQQESLDIAKLKLFDNSKPEEIKIMTKELENTASSNHEMIKEFENNKNTIPLPTFEELDGNEKIINKTDFKKDNNNKDENSKIGTEKTKETETIKNDVYIKETEENNVVRFKSEYLSNNHMNILKDNKTDLKIDNTIVENSNNTFRLKEKGVDEFSIIHQMTKSITARKIKNGNSITVKLKPEYLGEMTINIKNIENKCIARISTDRDEIKNIIASRIGEITTLLSEKMIKIDQIIVNSMQHGTNENKNLINDTNNNNMFNMSNQNQDGKYNQNEQRNDLNFVNKEENTFANKSQETNQISSYAGINLYV